MSISRLLTRIHTTGLATFGHNSRYTQLRTSDQEDKDDGYYDSSPDGSSSVSRSSQDVGGSAFDSLSSKLEGGSPDRPVPFHRPLQSERRGIIRRLRVWIALLAMLVVLVTILCHRLTSRTVGDVDRGPSSVIINTNLTEAGPTSTSVVDEDMLIDDPPGTPSPSKLISGVFRNGILELNNLTSLDQSHQAVTDMLGLTVTTDTDGRDKLETSTEASNLYMVVDPDQHPGQPKTYPALRPVTGLTGTQLITWFMYGFIDNGWTKPSLPQAPKLDVVMTWVNGSDPLWALERDRQAERYGLSKRVSNLARHWRDNGMGPYPIRSVVDAFSKPEGRSGLRRIHLVTADMQLDGIGFANNATSDVTPSPDRPWTMGQVPSWLDQDKLVPLLDDDVLTSSDQVELQMHFHSEAFQLPESLFSGIQTSDESQPKIRWKDANGWKRDSVPTFNSFAIEWQMGWLKGVGDLR
jgi:hypothetical protein